MAATNLVNDHCSAVNLIGVYHNWSDITRAYKERTVSHIVRWRSGTKVNTFERVERLF